MIVLCQSEYSSLGQGDRPLNSRQGHYVSKAGGLEDHGEPQLFNRPRSSYYNWQRRRRGWQATKA